MEQNILTTNCNYTVLNFNLLRKVPLRTALFIGFVYSLQKHYEQSKQLTIIGDKGYIYCSKDYIAKNLDIKRESLRVIVKGLVDQGILYNVVRGKLQFYCIDEDKLKSFISTEETVTKVCNNLLDGKLVKKERKHNEMSAMFAKVANVTDNEEIREMLTTYLRIRKKRGLSPIQWEGILNSFTNYIPKQMQKQRLQRAIEAGWMTLVFDSDIKQFDTNRTGVIYNEPSNEERQQQIDNYLNSTKSKGKNNNNDDGKYY